MTTEFKKEMERRGNEALKTILGKDPEPIKQTNPPKLSELKTKVNQMGFVFVDGKMVNVIIDETAPIIGNKTEKTETAPIPGQTSKDYVKPQIFDKVKKAILAGLNPVVFGPAGSGKSRMVEELAREIGLDYHCLSFSGGLRYSQVFGGQELKEGSTTWTPAPLLQWITTPCLILLDEIFSADPEVLLGLNSLLEPNTRKIQTPAGVFNVHPQTRFVAAANSNGRDSGKGQYSGVTRADDSLLDRLIPPFKMDYDVNAEKQIVKSLVDLETGNRLTARLQTLRSDLRKNGVRFDASTRRLIAACKMVNAGFELNEAFNLAFTETLQDSEKANLNIVR